MPFEPSVVPLPVPVLPLLALKIHVDDYLREPLNHPFTVDEHMPTTPLPNLTPDGPIKLFSTPEHMRALLEWIPNYERDIQLLKSRSGGKTKRKNKKRSRTVKITL